MNSINLSNVKANYQPESSLRLDFRSLTMADIETWVVFFDNNPNLPFLGISHSELEDSSPLALSTKWINIQLERYQKTGFGLLAAIDKDTGEFVGQSGVLEKQVDGKTEHEIAYSLMPEYWRKGLASEMSAKMVEYAIKNKVNRQIISIIHPDNIGSEKVAIKNGMSLLRQSTYLNMSVNIFGRVIE